MSPLLFEKKTLSRTTLVVGLLCTIFENIKCNFREVNISSFKAVFPYEHNFCITFHNEFLSIVKWLRLIHKKPNKIGNKPLPGDIIIKVSFVVFILTKCEVRI